jgi:TnpA family transposase
MSTDQRRVPLRIVNHVGEQLGFQPTLFLPPVQRATTHKEHRNRIRAYLKFRTFDQAERVLLVQWLKEQQRYDLRRSQLANMAREFLLQRRTMIPADSTLDRLVNAEVTRQERDSFHRLSSQLGDDVAKKMDGLLDVEEPSRVSTLEWLTEYPPEATPKTILDYMNRVERIRETEMHVVDLRDIRPSMINHCSRLAEKLTAHQLRRLPNDKRWSLVFSLLFTTRQSLLDKLVEMHRTFLIGMRRRANRAVDQRERKLQLEAREGLSIILDAMDVIVDESMVMEARAGAAHETFGSDVLVDSLASCRRVMEATQSAYYSELRARHHHLKRYLPTFLRLPFEAEPGMNQLLEAIETARRWHNGELAKLPDEVDMSFTTARWRKEIRRNGKTDKLQWEIALAFAIRDALRSGDLYLSGSKNHVSFWDLAYSPERWETEKLTAYKKLRISEESSTGVAALLRNHHLEARALADGLDANKYVSIDTDGPRFSRQPALQIPHTVRQLRRVVQTRMSRVRIEELLMKVDAWCGFSRQLCPPEGYAPRGEQPYRALMAAIVAHGTNLGVATMAQSTKRLSVSKLHDATKWYLRPETYKAANRALVDYHQSLPLSHVWGDGATSSSDGQRFGVQASSLIGSFYPRYFGYYDRALTIYTHVSDQYSVFGTRVISCGPREAMHVLDGLIENDTVLPAREHFTDTHGATDQIFGLCHLLGYSFRPRLKDLKDQKLYRVDPDESYGEDVDSLFTGTLNLRPLHEQWDQMIRLASSLSNRTAPAHVILQKLIANPRADGVAKALTALGRLVKTTFLLRYMRDQELRQRIRTQLNRGEHRHALARRIFFGNQGVFRTGDYEEMMNKASALSLLSNAVLVWNTVHINRITSKLEASDADLARVSPLAHAHVIPSGTYHFGHQPLPALES